MSLSDEDTPQNASSQNRKRNSPPGFQPELPPLLDSIEPELDPFAEPDPDPAPLGSHSMAESAGSSLPPVRQEKSLAQLKAERAARIAAQAKAGVPLENTPRGAAAPLPVARPVAQQKPQATPPTQTQAPPAAMQQSQPAAGQQASAPRGEDVVIRHKPKRKQPAAKPAGRKQPARRQPLPAEQQPAPQRSRVKAEPRPERRAVDMSEQGMLLHTHGLRKVYDGRAVVDGVDVNVRKNEIVGLLGPNGAGKTTSFYMIVGLVQPNGGKVIFNGEEATNEPMYVRARMGMGYLPQEESIFRKMTVEENIMSVMEAQGLGRGERRDKCRDLMKQFGIEKLAKNIAITLSGGEKRRLTIARSLVTNPTLLMLDEPFSGVDPIAVGEIQEIIRELREQGLAILITDHNVRETLNIVDRAYLMFEGTVKREGSRDFLINDPLSRKLYLGESFHM